MQFLNPTLVTGLAGGLIVTALIALPIIIHLINLMRYRRVKWAAMEFLLAAHKKSSTWILLKQLLLLLCRIAALLALLMVLAQVLFQGDFGAVVGGVTTHHIVEIDNTYSMNDAGVSGRTLLDVAKEEAVNIGRAAARSPGRHTFTLLTYTDANKKKPKFLLQQVTAKGENFSKTLESALAQIVPTEMTVSPQVALDAIKTLDRPENEKRRIYLLSDFRAREWGTPDDLKTQFDEMTEEGAFLHLVQCTKTEHDNLTITDLKPRNGALAAGISIIMDVSVKNHGKTARGVSIVRTVDGETQSPIIVSGIAPGQTETRSFEVQFSRAGPHRITAQLQSEDPVAADNFRHTVLEVQEQIPVLIVDGLMATGDAQGIDTFFLSTALKPGDFHTGLAPELAAPEQLGNPKFNLSKFQGIFLCNFDRLSDAAIENLEKYVRGGGGLAFFAGERFNRNFINERLYRDGQGLFPAPLAAEYDLIVDRVDKEPDLEPDIEHPVFRMFGGDRAKFLSEILMRRYYAVLRDWKPDDKSTAKIIARLRNQAPLAIEHTFENAGRVVALLTTAGPSWNTWARHPSYLMAIQELRNYLSPPVSEVSRLVGTEISEKLGADKYDPHVTWKAINLEEHREMKIAGDAGEYELPVPDISRGGIYELELTTREQKKESKTYVFNVAPEEGDLALVGTEKLNAMYGKDNKNIAVLQPGAIGGQIDDSTRSSLSEMLLYGLIVLLVLEQMLAYSASYHPPALKTAPAPAAA
jgi:hypothetical protein